MLLKIKLVDFEYTKDFELISSELGFVCGEDSEHAPTPYYVL